MIELSFQTPWVMLFALIVGHALADFPLQGEYLAMTKNRHKGGLASSPFEWVWSLGYHSAIHAGFVGLFTGSLWLALIEFVVHSIIDFSKCEEKIGYHTDQVLHIGCKIVWVGIILWQGGFEL